jgi:sugar lactone lactonase YvrE
VRKVWTALAILVGIACAVMAVLVIRRPPMIPGQGGFSTGRKSFDEQMTEMEKVDPALLLWKESGKYPTGIAKLTGLAVAPDDRIYAVGDKALVILSSEGKSLARIDLAKAPTCVGVAPDSTVYVGLLDHVEVLDQQGQKKASWASPGPNTWITSIAASDSNVYVADFGQKRVLKYDKKGSIEARIGPQGLDQGLYELPSPNFDVAVDASGSPWIVEPGKHLITNVRSDGTVAASWGKYGANGEVAGFSGCCNPTHLAIRRDGSFVTSEKGVVRVKVHGPTGALVGVVAQSSDFKKDIHGLDLAVDSKDRILVLDPELGAVRAFVLKGESRP